MKKKSIIYFFVIALVIGFASVTTNLIINNTLNIGFNNAFLDNVIFINTKTDGKASISLDGKTISYEAKELTNINEENILTFWIKNENTQYDIEATISCSIDNASENIKDLVSISVEPKNFTLVSNEVKSGEVKIEMTSVVTESIDGNFTCELIATPVEREETGVITDTCVNALNGAEPVINGELIPVELDDNGVVTYSDKGDSWYNYCEQKWANAVILVDSPSKAYNVGDVILESDIESYFVWIPRYKYKLFHTNQADGVTDKLSESIAQTIEIKFESKYTPVSNGSKDGEWLTHPAFTNFDVNGLWVGKFEIGYKGSTSVTTAQVNSSDPTKIQIKPNVYSWRNNSVGNFFKAMYNYNRELDSHMMKNTEWGAVAYLSHSRYGINTEVRINNNSNYLTGYASNEKDASGSATANQPYNTKTGYLASTTGNITGIYDLSGGAWEYVAGYFVGNIGSSELTLDEINNIYINYIDIYSNDSDMWSYSNRILGDATGEMGPFYENSFNNWYNDYSLFLESNIPWFLRGGFFNNGSHAGQFHFCRDSGGAHNYYGARLVLLG